MKPLLTSLGLIAVLVTDSARGTLGATIGLTPETVMTSVGQTVSLNVTVSDIADLFAFQFDVLFDPSVLSAIAVAEGPFLASGGFTFFDPGIIDNTFGSVSFVFNTLLGRAPGVSGRGILATLSFRAIGLGVSPVDLSNVLLLDSTLADIPGGIGTLSISHCQGRSPRYSSTWR